MIINQLEILVLFLKKKWVDNKLIEKNFKLDFAHRAPHGPDIGMRMQQAGQLCYDNFYEVWKKI